VPEGDDSTGLLTESEFDSPTTRAHEERMQRGDRVLAEVHMGVRDPRYCLDGHSILVS
jgi:hypothetical protein